MTTRFDPRANSVLVRAHIAGPDGAIRALLMLDTGASRTLISPRLVSQVGAAPTGDALEFVGVSGTATAPIVACSWFAALGRRIEGFTFVAFEVPPQARVDGLLGLDFLRNTSLRIDFRAGTIDLT